MNEAIKKLIEERSLNDIANALEIAVETLELISEYATTYSNEKAVVDEAIAKIEKLADEGITKIQDIAEGKGDE